MAGVDRCGVISTALLLSQSVPIRSQATAALVLQYSRVGPHGGKYGARVFPSLRGSMAVISKNSTLNVLGNRHKIRPCLRKDWSRFIPVTARARRRRPLGWRLRAAGQGNKVLIYQFLKPPSLDVGERFALQLGAVRVRVEALDEDWDMAASLDDEETVTRTRGRRSVHRPGETDGDGREAILRRPDPRRDCVLSVPRSDRRWTDIKTTDRAARSGRRDRPDRSRTPPSNWLNWPISSPR